MSRIARAQIILAAVATGLALLVSLYFAIQLFTSDQVCYGLRSGALACQASQPSNALLIAVRAGVVVVLVLALYAGCALGSWWQHTVAEPSARSAAFGLMLTCVVLLLTATLPALAGPGFFFAPSTLLVTVAAVLGIYAQIRGDHRDTSASHAS